jgi:hypothetical protein
VCTLIIGRDVIGAETLLLAANRDEDPSRASDPPGVLREDPRLVGGRDRVAKGTWLAVREAKAAVALLNRRDPNRLHATPGLRSRGLLTLDVAAAPLEEASAPAGFTADALALDDPLARAALVRALALVERDRYAPFTLVFASARAAWALSHQGDHPPRLAAIRAGWSVLTHSDLNDAGEPRTAHLLGQLAGFSPGSRREAEERLEALLRSHGGSGTPGVCLHEGRMVTVSSSLVAFEGEAASYRHADGRPCERPYLDMTSLLAPTTKKGGES